MTAMTFEMAMAQAMLNVLDTEPYKKAFFLCGRMINSNLVERTYALRRLRVRAGLTP